MPMPCYTLLKKHLKPLNSGFFGYPLYYEKLNAIFGLMLFYNKAGSKIGICHRLN